MAHQTPEHGSERAQAYDGRGETLAALLFALLLNAGIIGLFMFITWLAYAVD